MTITKRPFIFVALVALVVVTLSAVPLPAPAGEGPKCREMQPTTPDHERGRLAGHEAVKKYNAGKLRQALELFKAAYTLYPHTNTLDNIGQVERELGDYCAALATFQRLREEVCTDAERKRVDRIINVDRILCNGTTEQVTIVSEPSGASLWLDTEDGEPSGATPWRSRLEVGSHFVLLRKDGFEDKQVSFKVEKGKPVPLQIEISPVTPADVTIVSHPTGVELWIDREAGEPAGMTPWRGRLKAGSHFVLLRKDGHHDKRVSFIAEAGQSVSLQEDLKSVVFDQPSEGPDHVSNDWPPKYLFGWIATCVGGVGLLTGGALTLVAISTEADAEKLRDDAPEDESIKLREIRDKESDARGYQTASFIGYGAGSAFLAAGITLLVIDHMEGTDEPSVSVFPTPTGLAMALRF